MKLSIIRSFTFFLSTALITTSLQADTPDTPPSEFQDIPVITQYPSDAPPPDLDSERERLMRYKKAAAFVIGTIVTVTIGLLVSGADTGKRASSSS